ncbi:MAG: hypothetical protein ACKVS5_06185 [Parvularculaceae bacterium]
MSQSPTNHAADASTSLSRKLCAARAEESACVERLSAIEVDIALYRARIDDLAPEKSAGLIHAAQPRRRFILEQRISALEALRTSMIADRVCRRRDIDEMVQRKEAIDAALAMLRARSSGFRETQSA